MWVLSIILFHRHVEGSEYNPVKGVHRPGIHVGQLHDATCLNVIFDGDTYSLLVLSRNVYTRVFVRLIVGLTDQALNVSHGDKTHTQEVNKKMK
jgi:hypothetical protein